MTTLNPDDGYMVLINTFTVEPEKADELLADLIHATETMVCRQPGFVSATLHLSDDRRHVANYAQWQTRADYDAFISDPKTREHLKTSAGIATSFDPIVYQLREAANVGDGA